MTAHTPDPYGEVAGSLAAVHHALLAEQVTDDQRRRVMNRLLYGDPAGTWAGRCLAPLRCIVDAELLASPAFALFAASQMYAHGLRPDGTVPEWVKPADITWTDVTSAEYPRPDGERAIEINWVSSTP